MAPQADELFVSLTCPKCRQAVLIRLHAKILIEPPQTWKCPNPNCRAAHRTRLGGLITWVGVRGALTR